MEYFVSYYDYYQPEAYVPTSDAYIEGASINDHIEQMLYAEALLERRDTIIVASVSAIYGLGDPASYLKMVLHLDRGDRMDQRAILQRLADMQYTHMTWRSSVEPMRARRRDRYPPGESEREGVRVELFDDEIVDISV